MGCFFSFFYLHVRTSRSLPVRKYWYATLVSSQNRRINHQTRTFISYDLGLVFLKYHFITLYLQENLILSNVLMRINLNNLMSGISQYQSAMLAQLVK